MAWASDPPALAAPELPSNVPDGLAWLRARSHRARGRLDRLADGRLTPLQSFHDDPIYGIASEHLPRAMTIPGVARARLKPVRYFHPW